MRLSSLFFLLFFSGNLLTQSSGPEWLDSEHRKSNYSSNEYLVGFAKKELREAFPDCFQILEKRG